MKSLPRGQMEVSMSLQGKLGKGKRSWEAAPAQGTSFATYQTIFPTLDHLTQCLGKLPSILNSMPFYHEKWGEDQLQRISIKNKQNKVRLLAHSNNILSLDSSVYYGAQTRYFPFANWNSFLWFSVSWGIFKDALKVQELYRWNRELRGTLVSIKFYLKTGRMSIVFSENIVLSYHLKAERGLITQCQCRLR